MKYLEINNLKINSCMIENLIIKDKTIVGILSSKKTTEGFLLKLAGINKTNKAILFNNNDVFDNLEYFHGRLYMDFSKVYLKTLNSEYVNENVENRFQKNFDKENFRNLIKKYNVQREAIIDGIYVLNEYGNNLANFIFLNSLEVQNIIINYPTKNLTKLDIEKTKQIVSYLCDKERYNSVIIGIDNTNNYLDYLDEVLIVPTQENDKTYLINPNTETFLIIEDNVRLHDKLFKGKNFNEVLVLNNYTKEELKYFDKVKIKYKKIDFYTLSNYII